MSDNDIGATGGVYEAILERAWDNKQEWIDACKIHLKDLYDCCTRTDVYTEDEFIAMQLIEEESDQEFIKL